MGKVRGGSGRERQDQGLLGLRLPVLLLGRRTRSRTGRCWGQVYAQRAVETGKEKKWGGAITDMDEAIRLDPTNAGYFDRRGSLKFNQRQFAGAVADFTNAIRLDPSQSGYFLHRGYAHEALGKKAEAAEDHRRAQPGKE